MAGERLIGSTGITTSLALPAVVLKRPKKWAMTCLVCKTTVSVLRKKKERKKNLLISSQPTCRVSEYRLFIFVRMISSVFAIRGPSDTKIWKQFVFSIDRSRLHSNTNVKTPRIVLIFQSLNSMFIMERS